MLPVVMVLLCVVGRVIPHPPNFAPVGATAVFAGRTLPLPAAVLLVMVSMLASNAALAFIHGWAVVGAVTPFVLGGFALQTVLGRALRARRGGALAAAGLGAVGFFVLSNLGVWIAGGCAGEAAGLTAVYIAAIPFFGGTLAGDLIWTLILTQTHAVLARRFA